MDEGIQPVIIDLFENILLHCVGQQRSNMSNLSRPKPSLCWKLLTLKGDSRSVVCNVCNAELVYVKRSTTNLLRHLRLKHPQELAHFEESRARTTATHGSMTKYPSVQSVTAAETSSSKATGLPRAFEYSSKYMPDSDRKKELDNCVLDLVTIDLQPPSVVENKAFRRLMRKMDPKYELISRKTLSTHVLPGKYQEERERLVTELRQVDQLSVSIDFWVSQQSEQYLTVTAHFIMPYWQRKSRVLSTVPLENRQTAENVASALREVFDAWGIERKVTTVVSDSTCNVKQAARLLNLKYQPCFAHTLSFAVEDSIKNTRDLFISKNKVKTVVSYFHRCASASSLLKKIHRSQRTSTKALQREVKAGWKCTYEMLKSFLEQHKEVDKALCQTGHHDMCLSDCEVAVLQKAVVTLEPFYEATVEMSKERYASAAMVIPLVFLLRKLTETDESPFGKRLHSAVSQLFLETDSMLHLKLATLLDPRFIRNGFPGNSSSDSAVEKLREAANAVVLPEIKKPPTEIASDDEAEDAPPPAKKLSLLWSSFDERVREKHKSATPILTGAQREVERHLETVCLPREANPLDWWRDNFMSSPRLSCIAKDVLAVPATAISSDRLFSKAGELVSTRRSALNLKPANIDMILFLNNGLH